MTDPLITVASSAAVSTEELALFTVPIWKAVAAEPWWIPRLSADITDLLATRPQDVSTSSGDQTLAELQDLPGEHWQQFMAFVTTAFEQVTATAPQQRYRQFIVRSWGLRVNAASAAKDLAFGPDRYLAKHNHTPALLTSVFACELPAEPDPSKLPTVFHNPAVHVNCPWQPSTVTVEPAVGTLVIFPGWLEHSVPIVAPIPEGEQRITINTDYFPAF
jgi:hypothetical protein